MDKQVVYLSQNIKYLRKKNRWTQTDLANKLGKTQSLISRWEKNGREIMLGDIFKLCFLFDVTIENILCKDLREEI